MEMFGLRIAGSGAMLGTLGAFWRWHSPREASLTSGEIDRYLDRIGRLPQIDGEADRLVARLRPWAEADDGKPFYMINLLRFHDDLRTWPGAPEFDGAPREANAFYERSVTPLWLRNASYPILAGRVQGDRLFETSGPDKRPWSEVRVVRYPNRRTFLRLLSDPSYRTVEPYKLMSSESDLVAVSGDMQLPDLRLIVGSGVLAFLLGLGWLRARRGQ